MRFFAFEKNCVTAAWQLKWNGQQWKWQNVNKFQFFPTIKQTFISAIIACKYFSHFDKNWIVIKLTINIWWQTFICCLMVAFNFDFKTKYNHVNLKINRWFISFINLIQFFSHFPVWFIRKIKFQFNMDQSNFMPYTWLFIFICIDWIKWIESLIF